MGREIERAEDFARELGRLYGDHLLSAALYGSAARGEYRQGQSDLNLLVVLRDTSPASLRKGSRLARGWVAEGNPPPMVFSWDEWERSADVFPIEYADIRDAHRVLLGDDLFANVVVSPEHLRHQAEAELKEKHIQLRERYLLSAEEPAELGELLTRSFSTFLVLFRTVLRLAGEDGVRDPETVVRRTAERVGFDAAPLLEICRARSEGRAMKPAADDPVAVGYLDAVEAVVRFVDRLGHGQP